MRHRSNLPAGRVVAKRGRSAQSPIITWSFASLLISTIAVTGAPGFEGTQLPDRIIVTWDGKPVAHYVFRDEKILRPYFAHVQTADGIPVTRRHPPVPGQDTVDHATMHPGLWFALGDVAGNDFWRNKATIRHDRATQAPTQKDGALRFATANTMLGSDGAPLAHLESRFTMRSVAGGFLLDWRTSISPVTEGFYFGDQEEMGFGLRVADAMTEKNGGTILTSEGTSGAKASWGRIAAWSDYSGVISNRTVGIALFAGPENFRPSWFHNRDYGVMVANPFGRQAFTQGEKSRVNVAKGSTFTLRSGYFIHGSPGGQNADISAAYQQFIEIQRRELHSTPNNTAK